MRTTLGPRSMLKMLLDPMGGIVLTNDGICVVALVLTTEGLIDLVVVIVVTDGD